MAMFGVRTFEFEGNYEFDRTRKATRMSLMDHLFGKPPTMEEVSMMKSESI
jgi:hypothetical protein